MAGADHRTGTVAALLAGCANDEAVIAAAAAAADERGSRISILSLPRRLPLGVHCIALGFTPAVSSTALRMEALLEAATSARRAADFIPADIPADYAVVPGSPIEAVQRLVDRHTVARIVVDRELLVRRPRLRRAARCWVRGGLPLEVV